MKKLKIILPIVLITIMAISITTRVAYGQSLITHITEVIEKHIYYIDDVEVNEAEYNAITEETEITEITIEHRKYINNVYKINGTIVSKEEYDAYIAKYTKTETVEQEDEYETFEISFTDWNESTRVDVADYLNWEDAGIGVIVDSDKIVKVKYEYSDGIMSYTDGTHYSGCCANCYQMTEKTDGLWFTVGLNTGIEYDIVKETELSVGDYLFKFINNNDYADIKFTDVFKKITLIIKVDK